MILIKLLFIMFFIFPLLVFLLGAFALAKLRRALFHPFPRAPFANEPPPSRTGDAGDVIEGEYTVVDEKKP